jgi:hypothetical protein
VLQTLYGGLKAMLDYEGDDLESVFLQTFRVCYTDIFGTVLHHDLRPDGDSIFVTQENKKVTSLRPHSGHSSRQELFVNFCRALTNPQITTIQISVLGG